MSRIQSIRLLVRFLTLCVSLCVYALSLAFFSKIPYPLGVQVPTRPERPTLTTGRSNASFGPLVLVHVVLVTH